MCKVSRFVKKAIASYYNESLGRSPARKISPEEFNENYHLTQDLPLDEIGVADVIQAVEDQFEIDFSLDFRPQTVGDLILSVKTAS